MNYKIETPSSDYIAGIESFVVSLHLVYCALTDVNHGKRASRYSLNRFALSSIFHWQKQPKVIAHVKRMTYHTGYVWGLWGWVKSETAWEPFWTALPWTTKAMLHCKVLLLQEDYCVRCRCSGHWSLQTPTLSRSTIQLRLLWQSWSLILFCIISDVTCLQ